MSPRKLDFQEKVFVRMNITVTAYNLLETPYEYGAEWKDYSKPPESLDCSELVEACYRINKVDIPDGSQNQFNFTNATEKPEPGDLAFFGKGGKTDEIYHSGIVFDDHTIIESRGLDPKASFETGKVILRPRKRWEIHKNFVGYRSHPLLAA